MGRETQMHHCDATGQRASEAADRNTWPNVRRTIPIATVSTGVEPIASGDQIALEEVHLCAGRRRITDRQDTSPEAPSPAEVMPHRRHHSLSAASPERPREASRADQEAALEPQTAGFGPISCRCARIDPLRGDLRASEEGARPVDRPFRGCVAEPSPRTHHGVASYWGVIGDLAMRACERGDTG
jgi:hypothetical protein